MISGLRSFLLVTLAYNLCFICSKGVAKSAAECVENGKLSTFNETVTFKGYTYQRQTVNRSVSAAAKYEFRFVRPSDKFESLSWLHNGEHIVIDEKSNSEVYYSVEETPDGATVNLHVRIPTPRVSGRWKVILNTNEPRKYEAECSITAVPVFQPKHFAERANEGDPLTFSCDVETYPRPSKISWAQVVESNGAFKLLPVENATFTEKNSVKDAEVHWADATYASGVYKCSATTTLGTDHVVFAVRIKTKLAYIWPTVGILLEIIVLVGTIGVYEFMQSKRRKQGSTPSLTEPGK